MMSRSRRVPGWVKVHVGVATRSRRFNMFEIETILGEVAFKRWPLH